MTKKKKGGVGRMDKKDVKRSRYLNKTQQAFWVWFSSVLLLSTSSCKRISH